MGCVMMIAACNMLIYVDYDVRSGAIEVVTLIDTVARVFVRC